MPSGMFRPPTRTAHRGLARRARWTVRAPRRRSVRHRALTLPAMGVGDPAPDVRALVNWLLLDGQFHLFAQLEHWADGQRVQYGEGRSFSSMSAALTWARSAAAHVEVRLVGDSRIFWAGGAEPPEGMAAIHDAPLVLVELVMREWQRHFARSRRPDLEDITERYRQLVPAWRRGVVAWELLGRLKLSVVRPNEIEQVELLEVAEELGFQDVVIEELILGSAEAGEIERVLRDHLSPGLRAARVDCQTGEVELLVDGLTAGEAVRAAAAQLFPGRIFVLVPAGPGYFGYDRHPEELGSRSSGAPPE